MLDMGVEALNGGFFYISFISLVLFILFFISSFVFICFVYSFVLFDL